MRWQIYCCLAFGAQQIKYFTYLTPFSGAETFSDARIGMDNQKTGRWYGAQKVNNELAVFSELYMQYQHVDTFLSTHKIPPFVNFNRLDTDFDAIGEIIRPENKEMLVGCFTSDTAEHDRAIVCISTADPRNKIEGMEFAVELTDATTATMYYKGTVTELTPDENGYIHFALDTGCGAFITLGK